MKFILIVFSLLVSPNDSRMNVDKIEMPTAQACEAARRDVERTATVSAPQPSTLHVTSACVRTDATGRE